MELKDLGYHSFDSFMKKHEIEICDHSYLGALCKSNAGKGVTGEHYSNLLNINASVESLLNNNLHQSWLVDHLNHMSTTPYQTSEQKIHLNSKIVAELVAGGQLSHVFRNIKPLQEIQGQKNPDFKLLNDTYLEVYCPQTSQQNIEAVQEQQDQQSGKMVSIAFSRPLTGQSAGAKRFPANKVIDRVLSHKRANDQTQVGSYNLLWLDLTHGFDINCSNTQPLVTIHHVGKIYTGSFGVWHAFYGRKNESTFAPDRTVLEYLDCNFGYYKQMQEGLFRLRVNLNGALLLTKDGLVFFENPWSKSPLPEATKKQITQLYRFRANYSWFQASEEQMASNRIESELEKIEWLYQKNS